MTGLVIIGLILLLLFLLGLIRVGGEAEYSQSGLMVKIRAGALRIQVLPRKEKEKKRKKQREKPPKEKKREKKPAEKEKAGGKLELVKEILPLVGEAAGALKRRIRIDDLELVYIVGGADAAATAMAYGRTNAAVSIFWPIFAQNFDVKEYRIRTSVDFMARSPTIYGKAAFSARIGQLVSFAVLFGIKLIGAWRRAKAQNKK